MLDDWILSSWEQLGLALISLVLDHDGTWTCRASFSFDLITKHLISLPIERGFVLKCSPIC